MLNIVKRILKLAGEDAGKMKIAFVISFFEGILAKVPVVLVFYTLIKITRGSIGRKDVWIVGSIMIMSVLLRALARRLVDGFQSGTGYKIFARERMKIGDRLKRLPMGYFSEGNVGDITAVIASDLIFVEEHCMQTVSKTVMGYLSTALGVIMITVLDYRVGIITVLTMIIANLFLKSQQQVTKYHSNARQNAQSKLISAVLEYAKGISVIKSFNMVGERAEKVNNEFKKFRDVSINFEQELIPHMFKFNNCFNLGIGLVVLVSSYFAFNNTLDISLLLMFLIFIFEVFLPFKALGSIGAQVRIMEVALDRYDKLNAVETIDQHGEDIKLSSFDIEFKDVTFAYEEEEVLKNISFKVTEHSMTALVGKSGCGKTTIANLIARFWDVQRGEVRVGGVNVKDMTCDSLLKNISMVFQNVYLFHDTILNNIKFGNLEATDEEVIAACRKARCHNFIMKLENGYETMVDEGGASLSGGEKQRISIARAILKDAPIILLDEATASVDPDNERYIQLAISELIKDKTLVVIAHRLSTIKNADQILVIDDGRVIQQGTHQDLIETEGLYSNFWQRRVQARSWEISK
ncbi:MAG: ABC transporter ATP-binding protein [Firmicutes bacterium]|nr:ABC transporter ATP-binding protein [Bacillota bacterium]